MKTTVQLDVTRDLLVSLLSAYARTACPSAMIKILADAMHCAAGATRAEADAAWLRKVGSAMVHEADYLRLAEEAIFLDETGVNGEGLTFAEWLAAAGFDADNRLARITYVDAWRKREDPGEYRV